MDAREELLKISLTRIVTGVLLLIGFLVAVLWREALYAKLAQATEELSRQALLAAIGLLIVGVVLETLCIAYLLYVVYQRGKALERVATLPPPRKPLRRFGVHWDDDLYPLCPACDVFLPIQRNEQEYEVLWCPRCDREYRLMDDYGERVSLVDAKLEIEDTRIMNR